MTRVGIILILIEFIAFGSWLWLLEHRIRKLNSKLMLSELRAKDAEISNQVHSLGDADLDARLSEALRRVASLK